MCYKVSLQPTTLCKTHRHPPFLPYSLKICKAAGVLEFSYSSIHVLQVAIKYIYRLVTSATYIQCASYALTLNIFQDT